MYTYKLIYCILYRNEYQDVVVLVAVFACLLYSQCIDVYLFIYVSFFYINEIYIKKVLS